MKKAILSIAILASTIFAFAGNQQPGNTPDPQCTQQTCPAKAKGFSDSLLFKGITLTAAQQQQIKDLREKCFPARQQNKEGNKEYKKNKADKANFKNLSQDQKKALRDSLQQARRTMKEQRRQARLQHRQDYLNGLKQILTPDQYVQFLENSYLYKAAAKQGRPGKFNKQGKGGKYNKEGRQGKGERHGRQGNDGKRA